MKRKLLAMSFIVLVSCWIIALLDENDDSSFSLSFFIMLGNFFRSFRSPLNHSFDSNNILPYVQPRHSALSALFHNVSITTIVADSENRFFVQKDTEQYQQEQVLYAIKKSTTAEYISRIFPKTKVFIVPESYMFQITKIPEYDACFLPQYNAILLQTYLFEKQSTINQSHLLTCMANELSHASVFTQRTKKLSRSDLKEKIKTSSSAITLVAPWHYDTQKTLFMSAYSKYIDNVVDYKKLSEKENSLLSSSERKRLRQYDQTILFYISPAHAKDHYTANHIYHFFSNGQWKTSINKHAKIPSKNKDRVQYLKQNFFRELQNQNLTYSLTDVSIYSGALEEQVYADLLSDFDSLPSAMQIIFGPDLCRYLNNFHQTKNHCLNPRW